MAAAVRKVDAGREGEKEEMERLAERSKPRKEE